METRLVRIVPHALRKYGVPVGGPFDRESFLLACQILGNSADQFAIESAGTLELRFEGCARVCYLGTGSVRRAGGTTHSGLTFVTQPGESIRFDTGSQSARFSLSVLGGFLPSIVTKCSTLLVSSGDFFTAVQKIASNELKQIDCGLSDLVMRVRVIPGPHSQLVGNWREALTFSVDPASSRVGIRLNAVEHSHLFSDEVPELPSAPTCPGTIQLTPSGQLVVIGPDGPTTGGYPQVGCVCAVDFSRLARLVPGARVELVAISLDDARRLQMELSS